MQKLNDFVALKAMYNRDLQKAVISKNKGKIMKILQRDYEDDLEDVKNTKLDVNWVYAEVMEALDESSNYK